jgi:hypothetical protein
MPWITEIINYDHAIECLVRWFGKIPNLEEYAALATLLSKRTWTIIALQTASGRFGPR